MSEIVARIRTELESLSNKAYRDSGKKFFKEEVKLYGMRTATVIKIAKSTYKTICHHSKAEILEFCEELWQSRYMEESFIACNWAYSLRKKYAPSDFETFERWVNTYVTNWASCDTLCNHTIGIFVEMYPDYIQELKKWTNSPNRWMRRAAAVTLIIPARKGLFLPDIFDIANSLLTDTDDLVQKGYGWMLKSASQANQKAVFEYVMAHKTVMPRTALRYAIEKMPQELRAEAMKRS
jgi:3-methyladenine DNA glycosylase AlkD